MNLQIKEGTEIPGWTAYIYAKGETTQWSKQRNAEAHIYAVLENIYE